MIDADLSFQRKKGTTEQTATGVWRLSSSSTPLEHLQRIIEITKSQVAKIDKQNKLPNWKCRPASKSDRTQRLGDLKLIRNGISATGHFSSLHGRWRSPFEMISDLSMKMSFQETVNAIHNLSRTRQPRAFSRPARPLHSLHAFGHSRHSRRYNSYLRFPGLTFENLQFR